MPEPLGVPAERLTDDFIVPVVPDGYSSCWAQYTIRPKEGERQEYQDRLKQAGIPTAVYYRIPLHLQSVFEDSGYKTGSLPVSERLSHEVFSLPMHPYLTEEIIDKVVAALARS